MAKRDKLDDGAILEFAARAAWAVVGGALVKTFIFKHYGAGMGFAVGCFGAQALIAGLFAATARFTRSTLAWQSRHRGLPRTALPQSRQGRVRVRVIACACAWLP